MRQESYEYEVTTGNLWHFQNRAGATQTFLYDNRSRPAFFSWDNTTMARTTTYDAASRVTRVSVYDGDVDFTYNENNQVLTDKQTNKWTNTARTVTNTYDDDGDRLTLGYPSGNNYTFDYSGRDQLQTIIDTANPGAGNIVQYTYDTVGNRTARINRYNTRTDYGPGDALNRIPWLQHTFANGQTARFDYGFDAVSRRKYEQRDSGLADGYVYDLVGEATAFNRNGTLNTQTGTVTGASSVNTLAYDANGNRTNQVLNGATTSYTGTSDVNQYGSINGAALSYDGDANLSAYNGWTYSYDSQNRLISGSNGGSNTQLRFYYDGLNRQIMRDVTVSGTLTRTQFVYDGWNLIQEHNGAGTLQACYLHGAGTDEILMRFGGTSPLVWYHGDGRGNVARLSDGSGKVTERYTYGLGGIPTITDPAGGARTVTLYNNRFLFQGRDYIKEAGLYDYRNRFYHPGLSRFLQPDPIGFAGDPSNMYRYAGNDPVNGHDPSGLIQPEKPKPCGNECGQTPNTIVVTGTSIADGTQGGLSWNGGTGWDTLRGNNISGVDFGRSSPGMFDHSEFNIRTGVPSTPLRGSNPSSSSDIPTVEGVVVTAPEPGEYSVSSFANLRPGDGLLKGGFGLADDPNNAFRQLARLNRANAAAVRSRIAFANAMDRYALLVAKGMSVPAIIPAAEFTAGYLSVEFAMKHYDALAEFGTELGGVPGGMPTTFGGALGFGWNKYGQVMTSDFW